MPLRETQNSSCWASVSLSFIWTETQDSSTNISGLEAAELALCGTSVETGEEEAEKEREEACQATTWETWMPASLFGSIDFFWPGTVFPGFVFPSSHCSFGEKGNFGTMEVFCCVVSFILSLSYRAQGGDSPPFLSVFPGTSRGTSTAFVRGDVESFPFVSQNTHLWRAPSWEAGLPGKLPLFLRICSHLWRVLYWGRGFSAILAFPLFPGTLWDLAALYLVIIHGYIFACCCFIF